MGPERVCFTSFAVAFAAIGETFTKAARGTKRVELASSGDLDCWKRHKC